MRKILRKRGVSVSTEILKLVLEGLMSTDSSRPGSLGIIPVLRVLELAPLPPYPAKFVSQRQIFRVSPSQNHNISTAGENIWRNRTAFYQPLTGMNMTGGVVRRRCVG
jgi:hypothetical protein